MAVVRIKSPILLPDGIYIQKATWESTEQNVKVVDTTYSLIDEERGLAIMEIEENPQQHAELGKCSQAEVGFMIRSGNDDWEHENNFYQAIYGPELKNVHPTLAIALRFGICQFKAYTQNLAAKFISEPQDYSVSNVHEITI